jgi:hypothetical protein
MSPEQIQDIVMGTVHGMMDSGDLIGESPSREMPDETMEQPEEQMQPEQPMMPPEGIQQ